MGERDGASGDRDLFFTRCPGMASVLLLPGRGSFNPLLQSQTQAYLLYSLSVYSILKIRNLHLGELIKFIFLNLTWQTISYSIHEFVTHSPPNILTFLESSTKPHLCTNATGLNFHSFISSISATVGHQG